MRFFLNNHISFLGTGGGHAYTTTVGFVGIDMDLGNLYGSEIDAGAKTLIAGENVHVRNITSPLYDAGREFCTYHDEPKLIIL